MIETGSLRITLSFLVLISIFFSALSFARIPYQFYVWEIFIDGKIITMLLFLLYLLKRSKFQFSFNAAKLDRMDWEGSILWFFFPLVSYSIVITIGMLTKEGLFNNLENIATLILATVFDLPAVFVFSLTFIFIEEIVFRGILLSSFLSTRKKFSSVVILSLFFSGFSMSDVFTNDFSSPLIFASLIVYFFAVGVLTSALVMKYKSVWVSYSLRIGLLTISPLILTSYLIETDSFFQTKNSLFYVEGFLFSVITLTIGFVLLRSIEIPTESQTIENSAI